MIGAKYRMWELWVVEVRGVFMNLHLAALKNNESTLGTRGQGTQGIRTFSEARRHRF